MDRQENMPLINKKGESLGKKDKDLALEKQAIRLK